MAANKGEKTRADKRRGWVLIAIIALALAAFLVFGTMDADLRYSLIGL